MSMNPIGKDHPSSFLSLLFDYDSHKIVRFERIAQSFRKKVGNQKVSDTIFWELSMEFVNP